MTPLQQRFKDAIEKQYANELIELIHNADELSIACEKIADEFAIDFAEWVDK